MVIQYLLLFLKYNYGKIYQALKDYTNAIKCYEENFDSL